MNQTPQKQNDITALTPLESFRYENIFNVYKNDNNDYFYNILSKVNFPAVIDESYYDTYTVSTNSSPYTFISYRIYGTTLLWWLICAVNNIKNPVFFPQPNTQLKYLKPEYVRLVLNQIINS